MQNIWKAIPTWLKSILIGFIFFIPIVTIIQLLVFRNVNSFSEVPWGAIIAIVLLVFYWQFVSGKEYPFGKSLFRSKYSGIQWRKSIKIADTLKIGLSLLMFIFSVNSVGFALFSAEDTVQLATIKLIGTAPTQTAIFLYLALALTAGIVEEIVFRGYIQRMMIEKYGLKISFLFVAIIFSLIHFLPSALYLPYFLVSLAFSWVAYTTGSVIVGIIAHAAFDFIAFLFIYYDAIYVNAQHLNSNISLNLLIAVVTSLLLWREGSKLLPKEN
ncbi:MAG: membrane protease YdiL (CAAX protease family) [Saprospiraceae bacterium]|jgi:membrane protease YdiL (CAAX protease family)